MKVLTKQTDFGEKCLTWGASDLVEVLNETTWSNEKTQVVEGICG